MIKVSLANFVSAFKDTDAASSELQRLTVYARSSAENADQLQRRISELAGAVGVVRASEEAIQIIARAIQLVCIARLPDGQQPVAEFLRELVLMEKLTPVVADRIQRRFVQRFRHIRNQSANQTEIAFINTVAEYVMVCMGVLATDLFRLGSSDVDYSFLTIFREDLDKYGLDIEQLLQRYSLQGSGTIFWNRWAVLGSRGSRATDEQVRQFITGEVRKYKKELLEALEYSQFYLALQEAVNSIDDREELELALRNMLVEKLLEEPVRQAIIALSKTHWYPALDRFYQAQAQTDGRR